MSENTRKRKRKVDVKNLTVQQAEEIGFEIGKKITAITDRAATEINDITKIYGVKVKVAIQYVDAKTGKPIP